MGSSWKGKSCRGNKYNFCRAFVAEIQKNGVKIRKNAQKYRSAGWSLFIKGAVESQRTAVSFTGKWTMVRQRGERAAAKCWKYTNTPQIRIQIHKIHTERQEIHKYKNTDTHKYKYHCWESQLEEEEEEMRFFWKILLTKTALTSVPEKFQKLPGCQNDPISQGKIPPSKVECVKNLFMGVKGVRSIKKLGEDRKLLILRALLWTHKNSNPI